MNLLLQYIGAIAQDGGNTFVGGGTDPEEPAGGTRHTDVLIPFESSQYYENNIDILSPPDMLNNGVTAETPYLAHFTYLRGPDRPALIIRRFKKEWNVVIKMVRWYRASVFGDMTAPTKIHLWRRAGDAWVQIGSFPGTPNDTYVEYPVVVSQQETVNALVLEGFSQHEGNGNIGSGYCWPSELQIIGDWTEVSPPVFTRTKPRLRDLFAADSFWWNLNQSNDGGSSSVQNMDRINRHLQMGITNLRPYITRRHIEDPQGTDHWDTSTHGWHTDLYYQTCKDFGIRGHLLVMGLPPYLFETWEGSPYISPPYNGYSHPAQYFSPVTYANRDNREDPFSFDADAQFAYRAGLHYDEDMVQSYEDLNEADATWTGKFGHMDGAIMAAYCSATYDGHKGAMGAGRGIKNANPNIKYSIPGLAISKTDLIKGFIDWCIFHRGYDADGNIDLPFDIINYHEYSTDGATQFSRTTTAFPPELSRALTTMREYVDLSNRYCNGREVWVTEWGYDTHPYSAFAPPAIGSHTIEEVAGCWAMRTIIHQIASGISGSFWFQTFANNMASPVQFDTMRLLEMDANNGNHYPRTPVGDYYMQLKAYGGYQYDETLATTPYVMRFKNPDTGKTLYAIWAVETPFATSSLKWVLNEGYVTTLTTGFTEVTGSYNLSLPAASSVNIRTFVTGGSEMLKETKTVTGGIVSVNYGMFPTIVTVDTAEATPNLPPVVSAGSDQTVSFGATVTLSGSAIDPDGTLQYIQWTKIAGPTEKYRSSTAQTFSTGTKTWTDVPSGNYFSAGLGPLRFYCLFDDYLIGTIASKTSNGNGTDTVVANITSVHQVDAVSGGTYYVWDLGQDSVIGNNANPTTTVTGLVPGNYQFKLIAEDDDFATGRDTVQITVNP